MQITVFSVGILLLLSLVAIKRILGKEQLRRYSVLLDGALFSICFVVLGIHFYQKRENAGLLAVGMGAAAITKYLYDKSKMGEEN